jgi:FMN-dependent NADH-azoreductase
MTPTHSNELVVPAANDTHVTVGVLRQVLGFIGITDVNIVLAGSTLAIDQGKTTIDEFAARHEPACATAAA